MKEKKAKKTNTKATKRKKEEGKRFEDCLGEIDEEISKKRGKWNLKALPWIDYDDVSQIIRFHIFNITTFWFIKTPLLTLNF